MELQLNVSREVTVQVISSNYDLAASAARRETALEPMVRRKSLASGDFEMELNRLLCSFNLIDNRG